jgi:hypothetical protein
MLVGGQANKSDTLAVTSVLLLAYFRGVRSQGEKPMNATVALEWGLRSEGRYFYLWIVQAFERLSG